jgi:hypothetical protein
MVLVGYTRDDLLWLRLKRVLLPWWEALLPLGTQPS